MIKNGDFYLLGISVFHYEIFVILDHNCVGKQRPREIDLNHPILLFTKAEATRRYVHNERSLYVRSSSNLHPKV